MDPTSQRSDNLTDLANQRSGKPAVQRSDGPGKSAIRRSDGPGKPVVRQAGGPASRWSGDLMVRNKAAGDWSEWDLSIVSVDPMIGPVARTPRPAVPVPAHPDRDA